MRATTPPSKAMLEPSNDAMPLPEDPVFVGRESRITVRWAVMTLAVLGSAVALLALRPTSLLPASTTSVTSSLPPVSAVAPAPLVPAAVGSGTVLRTTTREAVTALPG